MQTAGPRIHAELSDPAMLENLGELDTKSVKSVVSAVAEAQKTPARAEIEEQIDKEMLKKKGSKTKQ